VKVCAAPVGTDPVRSQGAAVERRKLLATAGALSITAFAATVGLGANFGLFGLTEPQSPVGHLDSRNAVAPVRAAPAALVPAPTTSTVPTTVPKPTPPAHADD
jgi:hypothetical protein